MKIDEKLNVFLLHFAGTYSTQEIYFTVTASETLNALNIVQSLRCANDNLLCQHLMEMLSSFHCSGTLRHGHC
jgi:hypothetical protein